MLDLTNYPKIQQAQSQNTKLICDLVAISNLEIEDNQNIDTQIVWINNVTDELAVAGDLSYISDKYVVIGHEIAHIISGVFDGYNTIFSLDREIKGTRKDSINLTGYNIRSVSLFPTQVKNFQVDESKGNQGKPFAYAKDTANVEILTRRLDWSYRTNPNAIYHFRKKKSAVYFFLGFSGERILKATMFGDKAYGHSPSPTRLEGINITCYSKWFLWENLSIRNRKEFKNVYPKQIFTELLDYPTDMVQYKNGNIETDFVTTNHLFTKEYDTYGDIFTAVIQNGLYCCFDELERLQITTTFNIDNLVTSLTVPVGNTDIVDIQSKDDSKLIINTVKGTYLERNTLMDFSSLNNKYYDPLYLKTGVSHTLIDGATGVPNILSVSDLDLYKKVEFGDFVILKDTSNSLEFVGKVVNLVSPNETQMAFVSNGKDYIWFAQGGKQTYLEAQGYSSVRSFDLYYGTYGFQGATKINRELPYIYKHARNLQNEERTSNMNIALIPQIIGEDENKLQIEASFGSASNLNAGTYTGEYEEIDNIYGTFDNSSLLYDRIIEQYANIGLPPIFTLSNTIISNRGRGENASIGFDTYDNRDLQLTISESESGNNATIEYKNTKSIASDQILEINPLLFDSIGNTTIEINLTTYNQTSVGDVVKIKEKTTFVDTIEKDLYERTKSLTWVIQSVFEDGGRYFMRVDNNIPSNFDLLKYPFDSIVFLQEFSIKGNPIIQFESPISETNADSVEIYDPQEYEIDGKLLSQEGFRTTLDFFKNSFAGVATDYSDTREILPVKIINHMQLQKYDIITIKDTKYTGIDETTKWMYLGASYGSANNGNVENAMLININTISADPQNITLPNVLSFNPITNPTYNHQGNEGTQNEVKEDLSNPVNSSGNDDMFGRIVYSATDVTKLSAKVKEFDGTDLIVDNIVNVGNYATTLQAVGNILLFKIEEELITGYVKSWDGGLLESTITIIRRPLCGSPPTKIVLGQRLKFQTLISGSIEGKLLSSSMDIGNDVYYMRYDVDNGLEIKAKDIEMTATGTVLIENANNKLYFANDLNEGQLLMNVLNPDNTHYNDYSFHLGDKDSAHIAFNNTNNEFEFKVQNIDLTQTQTNPLGDELVVNGDFTTDTDWNKGTGWSISGGQATHINGTASSLTPQVPYVPTIGKTYVVQTLIDDNDANEDLFLDFAGTQVELSLNGSTGGNISKVLLITATTTDILDINCSANWDGNVKSISIKESEQFDPAIIFRDENGFKTSEIRVTDTSNESFFIGVDAGINNSDIALDNIGIGKNSLKNNVLSSNTIALGNNSLESKTRGDGVIGIGHVCGDSLEDGEENTLIGTASSRNLISGSKCATLGSFSMFWNEGDEVTAIGHNALRFYQNGLDATSMNNCSGLGYDTRVSGDNQVQLGNSSTTTYAYGAVQDRSDSRDKSDIKDCELGLDFLKEFRPVQYRWNYREDYFVEGLGVDLDEHAKESKKRDRYHCGFIAQEVKEAMDKIGLDFGGYQDHGINDGCDVLSLGYSEFIPVNTKAILELSKKIEAQQEKIDNLEKRLEKLEELIK